MLLINLTPVLHTLKDFRAYVLKKPTTKSNVALLANNTIVFNLTKTEITNLEKYTAINQYNSLILSYNKINYIDDLYQHLIKLYPATKTLNATYRNLFQQFFTLIQNNRTKNTLPSVILTRAKTNFKIRLLGLFGYISIFNTLSSFANLWNKKEIIDYKSFVKLLLCWLHTNLLIHVNTIFIKLYLEKINLHKRKKAVKSYTKKQTIQKSSIIFSNENIII